MATHSLDTDVQEEQSLLLQFIYQCPVGLAELDNCGAIKLLNALGVALLMPIAGGRPIENFFDLFRLSAPELVEMVARPSGVGEVCRNRRTAILVHGTARHLSFTVIRLDNSTLMIVFEDVTAVVDAERRAREAVEAQAAQSGRLEMATTVLHDIGNAITGIGTRSAQLLSEPVWPEVENLARMSKLLQSQVQLLTPALGERKAAALGGLASALERSLRQREITLREHMRSLANSVRHVQEILTIQRQYVQQRGAAARSRVVLSEVIRDTVAIHAVGLEKRSIRVELGLPADLPALMLDRTRMAQVFGNLIRNSCESFDSLTSNEQSRRVEISAERLENGRIRLKFQDNGSGFPPEKAESFFERGTTTKSQGTGVGLASCRSTVESHGGQIWMDSGGVGKGAAVFIELPTGKDEAQNA